MNYLFHIDDLSDDMNKIGTTGIADDVMDTLDNSNSYQPKTLLGRMTAEYVLLFYLLLCSRLTSLASVTGSA